MRAIVLASILAIGAAPAKKAILVSAEGKFAVAGGSTANGATIVAGTAVNSGDDAHAEINLGDAMVHVAPQTTFFVFGSPPPKGSKQLLVSDSTLTSGVVRVSTTSAFAINTPGSKLAFEPSSDAKVHVEGSATRVSVHKGRVKTNGVLVAEGHGYRVGKGKPSPLPKAPQWTATPKTTLTTKGEVPVEVRGIVSGTATQWHLQVALNAAFTEFLTDTLLAAKSTTLVFEQTLPPGRYYVRVSAIDAAGLEGSWSAVAATQITGTK